ncbi:hypothetical protein [Streptomyces sp. ECR2.10]|uniref:hypothetical protein n=2 Tax=unclassified Streptomyces TaxID=2593676 RepID=UPI0040415D82
MPPAGRLGCPTGSTKPVTSSAALTLTASPLGFELICLDASMVNVALPALGIPLDGGMAALQWVMDACTPVFAGLMPSTGAFAHRGELGFALGTAVSTPASTTCGLVPDLPTLTGVRGSRRRAAASPSTSAWYGEDATWPWTSAADAPATAAK